MILTNKELNKILEGISDEDYVKWCKLNDLSIQSRDSKKSYYEFKMKEKQNETK